MQEFNKCIDGLREAMKSRKAELYAIKTCVSEADEFVRDLYVKILCTVVQYENDSSEAQTIFLQRILAGMGLEEPVNEYMRRALDITEDDIVDMIACFKDGPYKYYFALDGILLASLGDRNENNYQYLAEIIELTGVNRDDLEYITWVARSILRRDSECFEQSKEYINERVAGLDFISYISNYFSGAVVETDEKIHYYALDKTKLKDVSYPSEYSEKVVIFENLMIELDDDWEFFGCEQVIFRNCQIDGGTQWHFCLKDVESVMFDSCKVKGFPDGVAVGLNINEVVLKKSRFIECGVLESVYQEEECAAEDETCTDGELIPGGLFSFFEGPDLSVHISECLFLRCTCHRQVQGVIMAADNYKRCEVKNNEFVGCGCRDDGSLGAAALIGGYIEESIEDGNKYRGELQRLFE